MTRIVYWSLVGALLLLTEQSLAATVVINIQDFQFSPAQKTIDLGDTVKWVNNGLFHHTSTSNKTGLWDTTAGGIAPGDSFTQTFNTTGSYSYHCRFHPSMQGTIIVLTPEQSRIRIGEHIISSRIVPITLSKVTPLNHDQVYLGSYIVNAQAGCANCHSCPTYGANHNPFQGEPKQFKASSYLAGSVIVTGGGGLSVPSANLTPDANGNPAGFKTFDQFKNFMRTGHDREAPHPILQLMPWPIFGMMSDYDLKAIYEYLRAIPHAEIPLGSQCNGPGS
ncbi:plastocyanin [Gammaproteobacteria bacterium]